jgi:anthranilate 1,2-dioxygenase small subunit
MSHASVSTELLEPAVGLDLLERLDSLQHRYVEALDSAEMERWLDCFSRRQAAYICIPEENERRGLPIALMLDDCRERIADRVSFITRIWAGTFEPYRTTHFVQRLSAEKLGEDRYRQVTNFSIMISPEAGSSYVLATGRYYDVVVIEDGQPLFAEKRAVYDSQILPRYIVYPF